VQATHITIISINNTKLHSLSSQILVVIITVVSISCNS